MTTGDRLPSLIWNDAVGWHNPYQVAMIWADGNLRYLDGTVITLGKRMTPATLTLIRKAERQSVSAFALRLGISRNTLSGYEKGKQPIPAYIALACTAIYRRLEPM